MAAAVGFAVFDSRENLLLRLLAEAVELRDATVVARLRESRDVGDPKLVSQHADFFRTESGNLQHFNQPRLDRFLQLLEKFEFSRRVQLRDFLSERFANTLHALELVRLHQSREISLLEAFEGTRTGLISTYLEGIFPLQFEQRADLGQHVGNFVFRHERKKPRNP